MKTAKKLANLADFVRSYNFQEGTVLTFTERYGQYFGQMLSTHFKRRIWQGSALAATTALIFGLAVHYGSQRTQPLSHPDARCGSSRYCPLAITQIQTLINPFFPRHL